MLLHPTYPEQSWMIPSHETALLTANKLLSDNGMSDFAAYAKGDELENGFYSFRYRHQLNPLLVYGGGAMLVVREADCLAGMLYYFEDFMQPDSAARYMCIAKAFAPYPLRRLGA